MSSLYDFLNTELSSSSTGGVNAAEGQDPSTVNDGIRQLKQLLAAFVDDLGAVNTVGGTGDAITVTLGQVGGANSITAYATGQFFRFIAGAANTGAATINVNSIGAKALRKTAFGTDAPLSAGDISPGESYVVVYRSSANGGAGGWVIVSGALGNQYLYSADAGAASGPILEHYRNSPSPAASDILGQATYTGNNADGTKKVYVYTSGFLLDPTAGSEDGGFYLNALVGGVDTAIAQFGPAAALRGTATNDDANAGFIGEYISGSATGTSLTSGTQANGASASFTAGDWDMQLVAEFAAGGATTLTYASASISTTSATVDSTTGRRVIVPYNSANLASSGGNITISVPPVRVSLASTTTVYGVALAVFGGSTLTVSTRISGRRVR